MTQITEPIREGTFEEFAEKTHREFCEGSAIAPALYKSAVEIHADTETGPGGEAVYPIHSALNWKSDFVRFGHQAREAQFGAFLLNEDGNTWQIKLSNPIWDAKKQRDRKYESPKGAGSKPYFPPVPQSIREQIAQQYGLIPPAAGESFWDWLSLHPQIPIILTEGAKKTLCLLSLGFPAIALYGVNGGYSVKDADGNRIRPQLIPELQRFVRDRRITLAFDQDKKTTTRANVAKSLTRFGTVLERLGARITVTHWDVEIAKGVDDLVVAAGPQAFEQSYADALPFSQWRIADRFWRRLTHAPTLKIKQADLSAVAIADLPNFGILAIASPKGTGKTKWIAAQVKDSTKALLGSHRIALARHLCHRLDLDYRGDLDKVGGNFITDAAYTLRVGFCVDSLLSIDPVRFLGCDLVIDEVCQVVRHLLTSSTCNKDGRRPALLARFKNLIQAAQRVIIADADLDDHTLNYLQQLRDDQQPIYLLRNDYQSQGYPARDLLKPAIARLSAINC